MKGVCPGFNVSTDIVPSLQPGYRPQKILNSIIGIVSLCKPVILLLAVMCIPDYVYSGTEPDRIVPGVGSL